MDHAYSLFTLHFSLFTAVPPRWLFSGGDFLGLPRFFYWIANFQNHIITLISVDFIFTAEKGLHRIWHIECREEWLVAQGIMLLLSLIRYPRS
jgi:hypothetical protein